MDGPRETPSRRRHALAAGYAAAVTVASLAPSSAFGDAPRLFPHADKAAHVIIYAALLFVMAWDLRIGTERTRRLLLPVALLCAAYGAALEWLQPLLQPGDRTFSTGDMAANAAGAALCALALAVPRPGLRATAPPPPAPPQARTEPPRPRRPS